MVGSKERGIKIVFTDQIVRSLEVNLVWVLVDVR